MKKYLYTPVLVMLSLTMTLRAQDRQAEYLGLPGDNLNLYAVMNLFQESETLEGFEKRLNEADSRINNLDLGGDGYVDYIRVIDNVDRNVHYIVLQVAVSPRENQDVAVFTVIRKSDGDVQIQLVGDEALYGQNYIIEPIFDETPNPGYTGRKINGHRVTVVRTSTFEIAAWPVVSFIYQPTYVVWHSPWYYNYYPVYWRPWNTYYWHYYYGYHYNDYPYYYSHYRHYHQHRYDHWHDSYYSHKRAYSPYVSSKINEGYYKKTYSRPEQRREGTALYHRVQEQNSSGRRTSESTVSRKSTETSSGRRTSTSGNTQQTTTTNTNRRTEATGATRQSATRTEQKSSTSTGTTRQSTTRTGQKSTTSPGTTRQSTTRTEQKSTVSPGTNRQSNATGSSQRTSQSTNRESNGSSVTTSGRRGGSNSTTGSSVKSGESKESSTSRSSGRR